jgi:hypothetical protein
MPNLNKDEEKRKVTRLPVLFDPKERQTSKILKIVNFEQEKVDLRI